MLVAIIVCLERKSSTATLPSGTTSWPGACLRHETLQAIDPNRNLQRLSLAMRKIAETISSSHRIRDLYYLMRFPYCGNGEGVIAACPINDMVRGRWRRRGIAASMQVSAVRPGLSYAVIFALSSIIYYIEFDSILFEPPTREVQPIN